MRQTAGLGNPLGHVLATLILLLVVIGTGGGAWARSSVPLDEPSPPADDTRAETTQGFVGYLDSVHSHVNKYWTGVFPTLELTGPSVFYTTPVPAEDGRASVCLGGPVEHDSPGPFYCRSDVYTDDEGVSYSGGIHLPVTTMMSLRDQTSNFAIATIVAHEYGHAVQHEIMEQKNFEDIVQMKDGTPVLENGQTVK